MRLTTLLLAVIVLWLGVILIFKVDGGFRRIERRASEIKKEMKQGH